jgi:Reverse transcriptase (RNA-dependent DNA polymerase)
VINDDSSLFIKHNSNDTIIILVYIDVLIIIRSNQIEIELIKKDHKKNFKIKDLKKLKYFLQIEITHSQKDIFLSQRKYILYLLKN